jgi:hypothetical protein
MSTPERSENIMRNLHLSLKNVSMTPALGRVKRTRSSTKGVRSLLKALSTTSLPVTTTTTTTTTDDASSSSTSTRSMAEHILHQAVHISTSSLSTTSSCSDDTVSCSRRRVSFRPCRNEIIPAEQQCLTDEEIENAWWNKKHNADAIILYRNQVRACFKNDENSVKELAHVVSMCYKSSSDQLEDMETAKSMFPMDIRGLESEVAPMLKTSRRKHSEGVLQYVHKIPKHLPADLRERMLSARSMQYSRPFKILAHVIGEADAAFLNQ